MSRLKTVRLPRPLVNQLLHQAQISPQRPVCGLIGIKQQQCDCYPLEADTSGPGLMAALNAADTGVALQTIADKQQSLFAIYHSHPDSPAIPAIDAQDVADYPEALYLLISLNTKGVLEMRGFDWLQGRLQEVELII